MNPVYLAVDMGGTRIKCGLVSDGQVMASRIMPSESDVGLAAALARLEPELIALCQSQGLQPQDGRGIGFGVPALVDHAACRVLNAYDKYNDAPSIDLRSWAQERWGLPLAVENDARLALIGEWQEGAARGAERAAIVTLGTGIGTAVLLDGRPLRGPHGAAGNLGGHLCAIAGGRACACGSRGCYEGETGSKALADVAASLPGYRASPLARVVDLDYALVYRAAASGDACALALRERNIDLWAQLCLDLVRSFDLDRIIIGGGIMRDAAIILPRMQERIDAELGIPGARLHVCASEHEDHMALLGVPWLVEEILESR